LRLTTFIKEFYDDDDDDDDDDEMTTHQRSTKTLELAANFLIYKNIRTRGELSYRIIFTTTVS